MITLDIALVLFIHLFFTVIVTFFLWICLERRQKSGSASWMPDRKVWQCSVCSYLYTTGAGKDFSRCPQCKNINERKGREEGSYDNRNRNSRGRDLALS